MHGLIFDTSIWLLAGSTRFATRSNYRVVGKSIIGSERTLWSTLISFVVADNKTNRMNIDLLRAHATPACNRCAATPIAWLKNTVCCCRQRWVGTDMLKQTSILAVTHNINWECSWYHRHDTQQHLYQFRFEWVVYQHRCVPTVCNMPILGDTIIIPTIPESSGMYPQNCCLRRRIMFQESTVHSSTDHPHQQWIRNSTVCQYTNGILTHEIAYQSSTCI